MKSRFLVASMAFAMALAAPLAAVADTFNIQMTGQHRGVVRGQRFLIPTYHVNFITSQQATSVVSTSHLDLVGTYAAAEVHASASKATDAHVMTKGNVSLALAGTGEGWSLGIGFGKFVIERR